MNNLGLYIGYVTDRLDPEDLGRIRFCIPGLIEPHGPWAWPLGTMGGGSLGQGFFAVPEVGAEVGVFFKQGCISEDTAYYLTAQWGKPQGQSEVPKEAQQAKAQNRVFSTQSFCIEFDERQETRLKLTHRKTGDCIVIDANTHTITIQGTTAVSIRAMGAIDLDAAQVTIRGRVVRPIAQPI